jgi:hypothetical protein
VVDDPTNTSPERPAHLPAPATYKLSLQLIDTPMYTPTYTPTYTHTQKAVGDGTGADVSGDGGHSSRHSNRHSNRHSSRHSNRDTVGAVDDDMLFTALTQWRCR